MTLTIERNDTIIENGPNSPVPDYAAMSYKYKKTEDFYDKPMPPVTQSGGGITERSSAMEEHSRKVTVSEATGDNLSDVVDDLLAQKKEGYSIGTGEVRMNKKVEAIPTSAAHFLRQANEEMRAREEKYDKPSGERSMETTVEMFNTLTEHSITERQGWMFMAILKMARAEYNGYREDDYVDGAAYFSLGGEAASKE